MYNIFILNPSADNFDIKDAIDERSNKAQAIISCFMANSTSDMELPLNEVFKVIWAVDDYIKEVIFLNNRLNSQGR